MKHFAVSLLIAVASTMTVAAPIKAQKAPDHLAEFKSIVAAAAQPTEWTRIHQNSRTQKWAKQYFSMGDVKYDVRKTDSLINPMIGVVEFPIVIQQSEFFSSSEEAEVSTTRAPFTLPYQIEITYHANSTSWDLYELTYRPLDRESPLYGTKLSMDRAKLEAEKSMALGSALQRWLR